ncbi:MAG TPA: AsmA-like C-terminal region-containing protein [Anaeromyxobacteraceae bacterium]|nr:AsmA-like C-terminal region-containing protein [Anaeromyxobacteraceae bacterium]
MNHLVDLMSTERTSRRWPLILGGVVAVLVVAVAALSLLLDGVLTRKGQAAASELSQRLGRPVEIAKVSTRFLTGLGASVQGVRVGPAAGEELPLLELPRAEVRVAALRAIFSLGKDVEVRSLEVEGLRVNVVRLADGTTNVERLQAKLAEEAPAKKEAAKAEGPSDLSWLRVGHAAIKDARIALLDRATPGAKELAIDHLDVTLDDLRAGKPLRVLLRAAVLAEKQNLELELQAAPLPASLVPTPERVRLKLEPIELAPLGPFVPKSVGLRGGQLQADLDAALGAAAPGGKGPTKVKGTLRAGGLRFAAQEGGRALDVTLDADLDGDAEKGDLRIGALRLDVGPASLRGQGRASGLAGETPRVEGLEVTAHDLDLAKLAALYPPLRPLGERLAGPIGLSLRGAGSQADQAVELAIDLTPVRMRLPDQLEKAAGGRATFDAKLRGAAKGEGGTYRFELAADLAGVDLRPGQSLDKRPGDPLTLSAAGTLQRSGGATTVKLSKLALRLVADAVTGGGEVSMSGAGAKAQTRFDLSAQSQRLDLDRLLWSGPKKASKPLDPASFAGLSGKASVKVAALRYKKLDFTNAVVELRMQGDQVTLDQAKLGAFGGVISAGGTRVALAHPDDPFHLAADLSGLELAQATRLFTDRRVLSGKLQGKLDLNGGGQAAKDLARSLAGVLAGNVQGGALESKDLVGGVTAPLARALPAGLGGKVPQAGNTPLGKDLPFSVHFDHGSAKLDKPLSVKLPQGDLDVTGAFGLDGTLDMPATVQLAPATIAGITGGKVTPSGPIPVTFRVAGPATSPALTDLALRPAVEAIVKQAGSALLGKALGKAAGVPVGNVDEAKKKAADEARQRADEARKKLEDQAKSRLQGLFK